MVKLLHREAATARSCCGMSSECSRSRRRRRIAVAISRRSNMRRLTILLLLLPSPCPADPLPRVGEASWPGVRERTAKFLAALKKHPGALPADVERQLTALLKDDGKEEASLEKLQDLLDPLCLVGIHINPESRVKAARGPASGELMLDRPRIVLLKIHNEGGITAALNLAGDELLAGGRAGAGRWLEAAVIEAPGRTLTGLKLEYLAVRLTPREAGKREATLKFD